MPRDPLEPSRRRLTRILGLPEQATAEAIRARGDRLLRVLRQRQHGLRSGDAAAGADRPGTGDEEALAAEARALEEEIRALAEELGRWGAPRSGPRRGRRGPAARERRRAGLDRTGLLAALLGVLVTVALLMAWAGGFRIVRLDESGRRGPPPKPARLILVGELPGATLRIFDADRERLFVKTPAEGGAQVELREGRYALEVSREDCPDPWTRSVWFEAGATLRFEPFLCTGQGTLQIATDVEGARLQIDGFDLGEPDARAHSLSVGDHEVRITRQGYRPFEAQVRIRPDETIELRADLAPEDGRRTRGPRPLPFATGAGGLPPPVLPKPEPFDLGDLREAIVPKELAAPDTRLLARHGLQDLPIGGSTAWHDRVSAELIARFDLDGSGRIDRLEESEAIGCPLWREIERDFDRGGLGLSMARYFGFDGSEWHPGALGFARGHRSAAYAKMRECGLQA